MTNTSIRVLFTTCLLCIISSCGFRLSPLGDGTSKLFGSVPTLVGKVSAIPHHSSYAYASTCEAFVDLIQLTEDDLPVYPAIASTQVLPDGSFSFSSEQVLVGDKIDHILEVRTIGTCDEILQRPVTHLQSPQIITPYTTVVTFAKDSQLSRRLVDISKADMEKLLNEKSTITTHEEAFEELLNRSSEFTSVFGDAPTKLNSSAPMIQELILPNELINEGSVNNLRITASHWSPDYSVAVQWKLNGIYKEHLPQWSYIPHANSQGKYLLEVYAGADDGAGKVNTDKPFHYFSKVFTVKNTILPSPPQLNITQGLVASTDVSVHLLTGPGKINCESFNSLAATVDDSLVPVSFLIDCEEANSQELALTLPSGDGLKTVRLWARDSSGTISALPSTATFTLDQTPPLLSLTTSDGIKKGGESVTLSLRATDASSVTALKLYYSLDDGGTYSLITNLTSGVSSFNWTLPSVDSTQVKLKLVASDSLGNTSEVVSAPFTIDSTAPATPVLSLASEQYTNSLDINLDLASCAEISAVYLSESATPPLLEDSGWQLCSNTLSYTLKSSANGDRYVYAHVRDLAGNKSSGVPVLVKLDQVLPLLSLTQAFSAAYQGGSFLNIHWSASDVNFSGAPIKIEYSPNNGLSWNTIEAATANDGIHGWPLPSIDASEVRLKLTAIDLAGNTVSEISGVFAIETTLPSISNFTINNNSGESSVFGNMNLEAMSVISKISHFCVKNSNFASPLLNDECWVAINSPQPGISPALNIQFSNYSQMISFTPGPTSVSVWVRTESGNISPESTVSVTVKAPKPPTVSKLVVANTPDPSDPVVSLEKTFNGSQSAHIKWKVTSESTAAISIFYTTNSGITNVESGLINGSNNGCTVNGPSTVDDEATGCFELINAPAEYFTITIRASDEAGISSQGTSYPLNATSIKVLAGNTDLGLNTSALTSIHRIASGWSDPGSLVVTTKGRIFLRDLTLGLVTVDPKDGIVRQLIPVTGSSVGDGGPVTNAKLNFPHKMALDFQDRLLIYDKNRIRRIDTNSDPMTIETIIGATPSSRAEGTSASNFQVLDPGWDDAGGYGSKATPFFALPNGDIYFTSGNINSSIASGVKIYRYQAADGKIYSITPSGTGHSEDSEIDIQTKTFRGFGVTYDPYTSFITNMHIRIVQNYVGDNGGALVNLDPHTFVSTAPHAMKASRSDYQIQGMDGKLYIHNAREGRLQRFEPATKSWTTLVGGGTNQACPDTTLATQCELGNHKAASFFISATGQIYFVDRFGILRVVLADKTVRRLMGQSKNAGNDGPATEARMNTVEWIDQANDGTIFVSDGVENTIRRFTINGNIVAHAASATTGQAVMHLDRTTKDLYSYVNIGAIRKFPFGSSAWETLPTASISYDGKNNRITGLWGFDQNANLLYMVEPPWTEADGYRDYKLANYNLSTKTGTLLTGYKGSSASFAADGTLAENASISTNQVRAYFDNSVTPARWLMMTNNTSRIVALNKGGMATNESLLDVVTLPMKAYSFIYRKAANDDEIIEYCGSDNKLHSYNITTATPANYPWPIDNLACTGKTLIYNSTRNTLIFPARLNNLSTVVEYQLSAMD